MGSLLEKSLNFNRNLKVNFEGGNLTSDAGLVLYRNLMKKLDLVKLLKKISMSKTAQQMLELIKTKI